MVKPKRMPNVRIKARIASKVREKDLLEKAKILMDDPELILPECSEDCGFCPFKKTKAYLDKIQRFKDDQHMLAKFSRRGDKLARAYAATIGLVHEDKAPYLASATYPTGTITFALRGKTTREKLIGVQNFDSPKWRVLSVIDLVHKKGLHFYSYGDHFICTGRHAHAPKEYVQIAAESVGATKQEGDTYSCPHSPQSINHLKFDWTSVGAKILVCDQCAIKAKNTLRKLGEGMAVPNVLSELDISVVRPLKMTSGKADCGDLLNLQVSKELLSEYSEGKVGDHDLIEKHMLEVKEELSGLTKRAYVKGDKCFGEDLEAFVAEVTQDETERKALIGLLSRVSHPVVADSSDSINKILTTYWSDHGKDALKALVSDELVRKYYRNDIEALKSPLKIIHSALTEARHDEVSARIPRYACLSDHGDFADKVAKAYKTKGQAGAISMLDSLKPNDHRARSISNAFYLALGDTTKSWKFTDEEREYGKHLQAYAKALLDSSGASEHHVAFETLLKEAGCSDELKKT
jgi:hypothetical protein